MEQNLETRELSLLDSIENNPDVTQADLATKLGVAVGTVNWHLKRLIEKGYIKVSRAERRKLKYIITPEGLALRARLTVDFIDQQFNLYRRIRRKVSEQVQQVHAAGYSSVRIVGEGDVADICRLTCIEQGVTIVPDGKSPILEVRNLNVVLRLEEK